MKNALIVLFYTLLIATFALWFGGFTFYVSFVVPIGTEVLGSAARQGFITQQVTNWLNVTCGFAVTLMGLELILQWHTYAGFRRYFQLINLVLIVAFLIALVWIHPIMDRMLIPEIEDVTDYDKFYGLHRIYLWLSTFQWVAAWLWLFVAVSIWPRKSSAAQAAT